MSYLKNNKVLFVLSIINLTLIGACIVGCFYSIAITSNALYAVEACLEIVTLVAAITYFSMGYKKNAARYYKMFMLLQASTFILEFLFSSFYPVGRLYSGIYAAVSLILYGNTLLLGVAKDLGKKVSLSLASFNALVYAAVFIGSFGDTYGSVLERTDNIIMASSWLAIAAIALIMTIAKYNDKAQRHTK